MHPEWTFWCFLLLLFFVAEVQKVLLWRFYCPFSDACIVIGCTYILAGLLMRSSKNFWPNLIFVLSFRTVCGDYLECLVLANIAICLLLVVCLFLCCSLLSIYYVLLSILHFFYTLGTVPNTILHLAYCKD